ncbi:MAG TPA: high-potential iron-sulfur protein [Candidatus Baltobacteraceae bacterium]|nr:high-potential iron-sulfur protein [Candidatus Baltobacteraceae bacterium]
MHDDSSKLTRASFVRATIVLPALAGLLGGVATAQAAKGSKAQFKYQHTPSGKKQCSNCTFFIPGKSATADGTCKIVEGSISPKGYCIAYSAKTK